MVGVKSLSFYAASENLNLCKAMPLKKKEKIQFNSIQKYFIEIYNCFRQKYAYIILAFLALQ